MSRTKGSKNKTPQERLLKKKNNKYKFEIGDKVKYVGGILEEFKNQSGVITKKGNKNHRIDYSVLFDNGIEKNFIKESVLVLVEEEKIDENSKCQSLWIT